MKKLAVISLLIIAIDAVPKTVLLKAWEVFKDKYGKTYASEADEVSRMKLFASNFRNIQHQNKRFLKGKSGFTTAINYFADLTESERADFRGMILGKSTGDGFNNTASGAELPASVDWREKGAVTPVKDQGRCGCCWAFSAVASLESHHYIATGELISLSEQNLIDCSWPYDNAGCDGGLMTSSFSYIIDNGGIDTEESYPYQETNCYNCRYKPKYNAATCTGYVEIPEGDEEALRSAVALAGPVSVGIVGSTDLFQFYKSGLFYDPCCTEELDHGVVAVGYGITDEGKKYWIVKNSWSSEWGEDGYMRLLRDFNLCRIADMACYPLV